MRGSKLLNLKEIADKGIALAAAQGMQVKTSIVYERMGSKLQSTWNAEIDRKWGQEMSAADADCPVEWMGSEEPLFMLYTSGSTGSPKGVLHTTAGYMLFATTTFQHVFGIKDFAQSANSAESDVFWCTADCGWITGHSYIVYGEQAASVVRAIHIPDPSNI
jgi:acetyl-CoA synthetase